MAQTKRRRRRRRLNPNFIIMVAVLAVLLVLLVCLAVSCGREGTPADSASTQGPTETTPVRGWMEEEEGRYYLLEDGSRATGWLEADGKQYLLDADGHPITGWYEEDGAPSRYFLEDGAMATGTVQIDGVTHHFTSAGAPILLVNPWNPVPADYEPDLVALSMDISVEGSQVDRSCYDALLAMIRDCNEQCPQVCVASSYRTQEYQTNSYNRKVQSYLDQGYSQEAAEKEAATIIAKPGTSEHQLGLAVDIIDTRLWALEEKQAELPAQKWLMENCWRYGFILRYPNGKIDVTGIIYEPWHYRYVGTEVAAELHESGQTLEEYLLALTPQ